MIAFGISRVTLITREPAAADRAIAHLNEAAQIANAPFWKIEGLFLEGKLLTERRDFPAAVKALRDAFEFCRRIGWHVSQPEFKAVLAEALAGLGAYGEALGTVDDALAGVGRDGNSQCWYVPELLRIKGDTLLEQGFDVSRTVAETCFMQAAAIARAQDALFWELRAALSLARLWISRGRSFDAREVLAAVYGRFTEGFRTAELAAARGMLDTTPPL